MFDWSLRFSAEYLADTLPEYRLEIDLLLFWIVIFSVLFLVSFGFLGCHNLCDL